MEESELLKYLDLGEDQDIEFKLAAGGFPNDAWRTISAFANMGGGYLVLGVGETNGKFEIKGVDRPEKLMKVFWDTHNNDQKLNTPLCNQSDIQPYRREHPREIGERLKFLVKHNWLVPSGQGRGTKYQLPTHKPADLFVQGKDQDVGASQHYKPDSQHYKQSFQHYEDNSEHYEPDSEHYKSLLEISAHVNKKGRTSKEVVRQTILKLCSEHHLSLRTLACLLKREPASIQNHYLSPMVKEGVLVLRFPERPNHPQQGYKTKEGSLS